MFRSDAYLRCTGLIIEVTLTDRQQKRVPVMPHTRARSRCAGAESVLRAMHDVEMRPTKPSLTLHNTFR